MNKSQPCFIYGKDSLTETEFEEALKDIILLLEPASRILLKTDHPFLFNCALIAGCRLKKHLFICPPHYTEKQVTELFETCGIDLYLKDESGVFHGHYNQKHSNPSLSLSGALYIFTSGTTGIPKIAQHDWAVVQQSASLAKKLHGYCWLMSYALYSYAGIQIFFSCFLNEGTLYYPKEEDKALAFQLVENNVNVISATPTYWHMLIKRWPSTLSFPILEQATVGGEIVTQSILDMIDQAFHPKRLTHIYASTEAGTSIVVSDRLAGFPIDELTREKTVSLKVDAGKLYVKSPYAMQTYLNGSFSSQNGWIDTGDLVEIKDERVYFRGREDELINVGGLKTTPQEIEEALCKLDEIVDCVAYAKSNPITGALVAADVVLKAGSVLDEASIRLRLGAQLPAFKIPRFIKQVSMIEVSPNGKKRRPK